jgi:hypothetical protein
MAGLPLQAEQGLDGLLTRWMFGRVVADWELQQGKELWGLIVISIEPSKIHLN